MGGIGDAMDKAKDMAKQHPDKVSEGTGKAAEFAKKKTGGKHDEQIDAASKQARERMDADRQRPDQAG
ncbi:antitoxin [Allonocardiopsis opalescens]|uniref:Antitoxin protein of toxin-antitoxin system n=1 Tax=Allonocardiopsis opalescens TaxID=1144618 RepID=A0A2T0QAT1_9ACTN|nr:antitoxin [Allonocardiopsis opalescens]PRY00964.1 antitoxin protein of toxin-antitoxin system [Allonocardiopsis opalescens]